MTATSPLEKDKQMILMARLHFDADDLAANQRGELSEHQRAYLLVNRRKNAFIGAAVVLVLMVATLGLLVVGLRDDLLPVQIIGGVLLICTSAASWVVTLNFIRAGSDLKSGQVDVVEGQAQHVVRQFGRAQAGSVRIGPVVEVPTDTESFAAFEPGATYRLYRTSHTGALLSIEQVEGAATPL